MTFRFTTVVLFLALSIIATMAAKFKVFDPAPQVCYLVADNDGRATTRDILTKIDPVTGVETPIGPTGTDFVEAIAFSPFRSTLFAIDGGLLGSLNLQSGKFSPIGKVGHGIGSMGDLTFSDVDGLTVDPRTGVLFGSARLSTGNFLIQINSSTGSIVDHAFGITFDYVPVGPLDPRLFVDDLAVNPLDGQLYAVATDTTRTLLITINKVSGTAEIVTEVDALEVEGLTFDADGVLYGVVGAAGRKVVTIDTATGNVQPVFQLGEGGNYDYESIACVTTGTLPEPDFVPSNSRAPGDIRIESAFPIPASTKVTLRVRFTKTLTASLDVYDIRGRRVWGEPERVFEAGIYDIPVDASRLDPGVYHYRLRSRLQNAYGDFLVAR